MKESEFYKNAFDDQVFRREKLEELSYFKKVGIGLLTFEGLCWAVHTIYAGMNDGGWDAGMGWLAALAITGGTYSVVVTRLAALEEIERRVAPASAERESAKTCFSRV